jgi:hypothetical protein
LASALSGTAAPHLPDSALGLGRLLALADPFCEILQFPAPLVILGFQGQAQPLPRCDSLGEGSQSSGHLFVRRALRLGPVLSLSAHNALQFPQPAHQSGHRVLPQLSYFCSSNFRWSRRTASASCRNLGLGSTSTASRAASACFPSKPLADSFQQIGQFAAPLGIVRVEG